jgi:hypothetical protein
MAAGHRAATRSVLEGREHAGRLAQIEMSGTEMNETTVLALGLGLTPPWRLVNQRLETGRQPHELHLEVAAERGSLFPCPVCANPHLAFQPLRGRNLGQLRPAKRMTSRNSPGAT